MARARIMDQAHFTVVVSMGLKPRNRFVLPPDQESRTVLEPYFRSLERSGIVKLVDDVPDCYTLTGKPVACLGLRDAVGTPFTVELPDWSGTFNLGESYDMRFIREGVQVAYDIGNGLYRMKYVKPPDGPRKAVFVLAPNMTIATLVIWSQLWDKPVGDEVAIQGMPLTASLGVDLTRFYNGCSTMPKDKFFHKDGKVYSRLPENAVATEFICSLANTVFEPFAPLPLLCPELVITSGDLNNLTIIARNHFTT